MHRELQSGISHKNAECAEKAVRRVQLKHFAEPHRNNLNCLSLCLCVSAAILLSSCGYHVSGTASRLPPGLKTIDVSAFDNRTNQYRIEQRMTQAVVREFLERTRYRIVSTEDSADAVLRGEITTLESSPVVFFYNPPQT